MRAFTCRYSDPLKDYVCSAELRWRARHFALAADAGADQIFGIEQPAAVSCHSADGGPSCPTDSPQCTVDCCRGGDGQGAGCSACCRETSCEQLPADACPAPRCTLRRGCSGSIICTTPVSPPWPCGIPGSWGATCCEGLVESCTIKIVSDGSCLADRGYNGVPICLACGDGLCEFGEDDCNCPADCH